MKLVVAVTGATGAIYAQRALAALAGRHEVDLVLTRNGRLVWQHELGVEPGLPSWNPSDMTAPFASGSARYDGMLVIPCTSGTLGRIAHGVSTDLVCRAADVMLKERRPLVLVLRETPYSLVHIRNMELVTLAGGTILPATPSFYGKPRDIEALADTVVSRALDRLGVPNDLVPRWPEVNDD
jgi:4-hydroxy-3-polyprenylbenzoate decarboxylase